MEYTKEQINFIQSRKPEFIPKPVPSLDAVIVEFLLKYEVYVTPPKNSKAKDEGIAGAVAGGLLAGPDLAGDALLIRGQKQQTNIQEWTQWKQWALDHKDFEAFRVEKIDNPKTHNSKILESLKDPKVQKGLEPLLKEYDEFQKRESQKANTRVIGFLIFVGLCYLGLVAIPYMKNFKEGDNTDSLQNQIVNTELDLINCENNNGSRSKKCEKFNIRLEKLREKIKQIEATEYEIFR